MSRENRVKRAEDVGLLIGTLSAVSFHVVARAARQVIMKDSVDAAVSPRSRYIAVIRSTTNLLYLTRPLPISEFYKQKR